MGILNTVTQGARQAARVGAWAAGQVASTLEQLGGAGEEADARDGDAPAEQREPQQQEEREEAQPERSAEPKALGDVDLKNKVSTEIFRGLRGVDKGAIDINVVDGVVFLRGEAKTPARVNQLEERTRAIPEVVEVQNLLHLPKTPAPTRTDTPPSQRKTRSKRTPPQRPRAKPRRVNADKTIAQGEPLPERLAEEHKGRQPAPFGAEGGTDESDAPSPGEVDRSGRGEDSGREKKPTTRVGTEEGPDGGGGEVVH